MTARPTLSHEQHSRSWLWSGLYLLVVASFAVVSALGLTGWRQAVFLVLAVAVGGATLVRRRCPHALTLTAWATTAWATQIFLIPALFNLGVRGRDRRGLLALAVTVVLLAAVAPREELLVSVDGVDPAVWSGLGSWVLNAVVIALVPYLIGRSIAARRELTESYRLRAEHAEAERSARAAESVLVERARIAREAHDVLGHKLSLLAMQAGGLRLNANAGARVVEMQARLIQQSARGALDDLRSIIRSVEAPEAGAADRAARAPAAHDLHGIRKLVAESVSSGAIVALDTAELQFPERVPGDVSRAAHRVVQECLTNAHRHAPEAPVTVSVSGGPGEGFVVEVRNTVTVSEETGTEDRPGGRGLPGLRERARVVGGELAVDETDSVFIVRARFPWPADRGEEVA